MAVSNKWYFVIATDTIEHNEYIHSYKFKSDTKFRANKFQLCNGSNINTSEAIITCFLNPTVSFTQTNILCKKEVLAQ
jgi:hypothetical protein